MIRLFMTLLVSAVVLSACAHTAPTEPKPAGEIQILPSGDIILKSTEAPDSESEVNIKSPSVGPNRGARP